MAETLQLVAEKKAYTLTDRASYVTTRTQPPLRILVEGDSLLINRYSVIPVASSVNQRGGDAFAQWITDSTAQSLIGRFGRDQYAAGLFHPNARGCKS
jgi:tungstate transport system substrate-binding protein